MDESQNVADYVIAHLRGEGLDNSFRAQYRKLLKELSKRIADARPRVVLRTPGYVKPAITLAAQAATAC